MIFVMERTFLSWRGQYFCVCEVAVNKEKLSDVNKDLKHFSYALISDELSHNKGSVYVFNKALLDDVSKKISFKKVHYWSDGAGSQFKNRFN